MAKTTANYSKKVMQLFMHPKNVGEIKNADGIGKVGNPQCGDIMWIYIKVSKNKKGQEILADVKFKTFGCLPPDGEILRGEGDWAEIQSVSKGDNVLNSDGNRTKVVETYVREYSGPMLTITPFVSRLNEFSLTPEHPVLCIKRQWLRSARKCSNKCRWLRLDEKELTSRKPDFVEAGNLEVSDYLIFVPNNKINDIPNLTKDMLGLIGYYLSEGYTVANDSVIAFALNKNEKKNIAELKSFLFKITGKKAKERTRKNVTEIYICSRKWANFFVSICGKYAVHKKLAENILTLPLRKQWQMIETYIKGDGNLYKRRIKDSPTYRINTASRNLAIQMQEILARVGIFASIKKDTRDRSFIEGRKVSYKPLYEISFKLQKKHKFVHTNGKYLLVPIKKIEKKHYVGKVYNFQVLGEPHSYLVKGFAVHNCAAAIATSSMITGLAKGKTLEEAMKITRNDVADSLEGLPVIKLHCSNLAADGLHAAILDYYKKKGDKDMLEKYANLKPHEEHEHQNNK